MVITAQGTSFPGTLSSLGTRRAYSSSTIISRADGQMVPTDYGATTQHATADVHEVMRVAAARLAAAAAINCDDAAHNLQKKKRMWVGSQVTAMSVSPFASMVYSMS